ncbi:MAG: hypothetical protein J4469_05080 [Candidatus Aenigmarchaeota archaeon]|nr:hypothetical protein [Candidatus Aenigmarchaeota archaeon]
MIIGTMIKKKLDEESFYQKLRNYTRDKIECTPHSFFRFSEEQRKRFNCDFARDILLNRKPILAGLQYNGNYALFYDFEDNKLLRIMIIFISGRIRVLTFYTIEKHQLPKL